MPSIRSTKIFEGLSITGISGRFPYADSVGELKENLFNGIDMVTDNDKRWQKGILGVPSRFGVIKDLTCFDASFFGVHGKQATMLDPQFRMLMEATYEAIVDAGVYIQVIKN